ncbi:MAG: sulfate permease [Desulfobacterales bacterium]|nr:sulfate permease [Desulfobacterales bacterium]
MKPINPYSSGASLWRKWFPFLRWWNFIAWDTLRADVLAGLTGAVIVLPQGVAFAMIAGLPPEYGLYTAIVPPIIAALFGSSLHLISGPTTAISIIVFTSISPLAVPGSPEFIRLTLTLTFLAGIYQLAFGLARMGTLVNFVSHSVVVGFTAGAAILIITSQMKHVLGIEVPKGQSFVGTLYHIGSTVDLINPRAAVVALVTLLCALVFKRLRPHWPGLLFALISGSLASLALEGAEHGVSLLGRMPDRLPPLSLPDFSPQTLRDLMPKALAVALLGLIEALSIGRSIAAQSRQQIDGNQEFIGQGLSNIVGSFFSCYAGSGSFTRSGINYHAGAMTPLAAVFAALFLALLLLLVAPLTAFLPIPAMGGVIFLVAYNLINPHHIRTIIKISKQETGVLLATFLATLFLDLEFAIFAGVLLSLVLYLGTTAHPEIVTLMPNPNPGGPELIEATMTCPNFIILRIDGPLFFGAVNHVADYLYHIDQRATYKRHVLVVGCGINFIDVAGAQLLAYESQRRSRLRGGLYLCELKPQVKDLLARGGYIDTIGKDHLFATVSEARANILSRFDCADCTQYSLPQLNDCPIRRPDQTIPV